MITPFSAIHLDDSAEKRTSSFLSRLSEEVQKLRRRFEKCLFLSGVK
jgi:hypothetical protein